MDDLYGVAGVHHDSPTTTIELADDGTVFVKASQLAPTTGADPWPALVEIEADVEDVRRRGGPGSLWLYAAEAVELAAALPTAAVLCEIANRTP